MESEKINGQQVKNSIDSIESNKEPTLHEAFMLLSRRESEILKRRMEGLQNKDIAAECSISLRTVENHISSICKSLSLTGKGNLRNWIHKQRKHMKNGKLNT